MYYSNVCKIVYRKSQYLIQQKYKVLHENKCGKIFLFSSYHKWQKKAAIGKGGRLSMRSDSSAFQDTEFDSGRKQTLILYLKGTSCNEGIDYMDSRQIHEETSVSQQRS
jgi:hypothetical protein